MDRSEARWISRRTHADGVGVAYGTICRETQAWVFAPTNEWISLDRYRIDYGEPLWGHNGVIPVPSVADEPFRPIILPESGQGGPLPPPPLLAPVVGGAAGLGAAVATHGRRLLSQVGAHHALDDVGARFQRGVGGFLRRSPFGGSLVPTPRRDSEVTVAGRNSGGTNRSRPASAGGTNDIPRHRRSNSVPDGMALGVGSQSPTTLFPPVNDPSQQEAMVNIPTNSNGGHAGSAVGEQGGSMVIDLEEVPSQANNSGASTQAREPGVSAAAGATTDNAQNVSMDTQGAELVNDDSLRGPDDRDPSHESGRKDAVVTDTAGSIDQQAGDHQSQRNENENAAVVDTAGSVGQSGGGQQPRAVVDTAGTAQPRSTGEQPGMNVSKNSAVSDTADSARKQVSERHQHAAANPTVSGKKRARVTPTDSRSTHASGGATNADVVLFRFPTVPLIDNEKLPEVLGAVLRKHLAACVDGVVSEYCRQASRSVIKATDPCMIEAGYCRGIGGVRGVVYRVWPVVWGGVAAAPPCPVVPYCADSYSHPKLASGHEMREVRRLLYDCQVSDLFSYRDRDAQAYQVTPFCHRALGCAVAHRRGDLPLDLFLQYLSFAGVTKSYVPLAGPEIVAATSIPQKHLDAIETAWANMLIVRAECQFANPQVSRPDTLDLARLKRIYVGGPHHRLEVVAYRYARSVGLEALAEDLHPHPMDTEMEDLLGPDSAYFRYMFSSLLDDFAVKSGVSAIDSRYARYVFCPSIMRTTFVPGERDYTAWFERYVGMIGKQLAAPTAGYEAERSTFGKHINKVLSRIREAYNESGHELLCFHPDVYDRIACGGLGTLEDRYERYFKMQGWKLEGKYPMPLGHARCQQFKLPDGFRPDLCLETYDAGMEALTALRFAQGASKSTPVQPAAPAIPDNTNGAGQSGSGGKLKAPPKTGEPKAPPPSCATNSVVEQTRDSVGASAEDAIMLSGSEGEFGVSGLTCGRDIVCKKGCSFLGCTRVIVG